jgi:hypothetical protein
MSNHRAWMRKIFYKESYEGMLGSFSQMLVGCSFLKFFVFFVRFGVRSMPDTAQQESLCLVFKQKKEPSGPDMSENRVCLNLVDRLAYPCRG